MAASHPGRRPANCRSRTAASPTCRSGLRVDDIELTSRLLPNGTLELDGRFRAGDGRGEIVSRGDLITSGVRGAEIQVRGDNLTLVDVRDVKARADVDVSLRYDYDTLGVDGSVVVPHARVVPSNLTVTRDIESEDVVIVAGSLPDDETRAADQPLQIDGSLDLGFGDDVLIDLGVATANLSGNTTFTWDGGLIPMADGRYDLVGTVQAFGQILEITSGGLRFPQIPADNPMIRLRAERQIYGNAQVKTAGILVSGTARRPTVSAYTRPMTTEERALALLITGSDFDFEQGAGAIDFGTYIAPRVFVSYGVGLFEQQNVIRVRYDLTRGFGVTATSGEKESGLDLNYRLER